MNLISLEIAITKNNLLATIPRMSTEWSISFQFRQTSLSPVWTNIIRFASANTTYGSPITIGKRIPAVFININSRKLHFTHAVNGMANYIVNGEATDNKLNDNHHIEIHQRYVSRGDYRYFIKINGTEIHSTINSDARQFYNVNVYASDPWYENVNGFISNFDFTNFL